jgi:hypothetical protein
LTCGMAYSVTVATCVHAISFTHVKHTSTAFIKTILTKFATDQQHYVAITYVEFQLNRTTHVDGTGRNSVTTEAAYNLQSAAAFHEKRTRSTTFREEYPTLNFRNIRHTAYSPILCHRQTDGLQSGRDLHITRPFVDFAMKA